MKPEEVEIPARLRKRPLWHDYPITYVTFIGNDGSPDFKVVDDKKRRDCLYRSLCGLCGEKLDSTIVFIGGPGCVQQRLFLDPPMHRDCALYAAQVCPYLCNAEGAYAKQPPKHLGEGNSVFRIYQDADTNRPNQLAVYYCRNYDMVRHKGIWYAKAGKPFKVDWTVMPQSKRKK